MTISFAARDCVECRPRPELGVEIISTPPILMSFCLAQLLSGAVRLSRVVVVVADDGSVVIAWSFEEHETD